MSKVLRLHTFVKNNFKNMGSGTCCLLHLEDVWMNNSELHKSMGWGWTTSGWQQDLEVFHQALRHRHNQPSH